MDDDVLPHRMVNGVRGQWSIVRDGRLVYCFSQKGNLCPAFDIDVDPVTTSPLTPLASPVSACFILQAYQDQRTITIIIEKAQLIRLPLALNNSFAQISQQYPES
jgi:hypothetical protein